MKTIFLPTDFSKQSAYAETLATRLAIESGAKIHLFHSVKSPVDWTKIKLADEAKYPEVKRQVGSAKAKMEAFANKNKTIKVTYSIGFNSAHQDIPLTAKKEKADIIVIGAHGESGFDEEHLGSNSRKVIRRSEIPMLIVRKKPTTELPRKIVIACDFAPDSIPALKKVVSMLSFLKPQFHLLFVNTPGHFHTSDEIGLRMRKASEFIKLPKEQMHVFNYHYIEDGISKFVEFTKPDAAVFMSREKKGFLSDYANSYTENTAELLEIPLFVFKI